MKNSKNVEIEKFYDKLSKNANLLKKIRNKKKNYKDLNEFTKKVILPISKKSGHNFSVKDLIEYEKKALLSNKNPEITPISDEKLSDASGGVGKKTLTSLSLVVAATPISAGIFSPTSQTASAVGEADQEQGTQAVAAQERAEVTNPTWEAFKRKYQDRYNNLFAGGEHPPKLTEFCALCREMRRDEILRTKHGEIAEVLIASIRNHQHSSISLEKTVLEVCYNFFPKTMYGTKVVNYYLFDCNADITTCFADMDSEELDCFSEALIEKIIDCENAQEDAETIQRSKNFLNTAYLLECSSRGLDKPEEDASVEETTDFLQEFSYFFSLKVLNNGQLEKRTALFRSFFRSFFGSSLRNEAIIDKYVEAILLVDDLVESEDLRFIKAEMLEIIYDHKANLLSEGQLQALQQNPKKQSDPFVIYLILKTIVDNSKEILQPIVANANQEAMSYAAMVEREVANKEEFRRRFGPRSTKVLETYAPGNDYEGSRGTLEEIPEGACVICAPSVHINRRVIPLSAHVLEMMGKPIDTSYDEKPIGFYERKAKEQSPLFPHEPTSLDCMQSNFGNCYFLAAAIALLNTPGGADIISSIMRDNGDGTVTVKQFDKFNVPHYIVLPKVIPKNRFDSYTEKIFNATKHVNWPDLLMLAHVICQQFENFNFYNNHGGGYARGDGGFVVDVFRQWGFQNACDSYDYTFEQIKSSVESGKPVSANTLERNDGLYEGMLSNHEYAVVDTIEKDGIKFILILDPSRITGTVLHANALDLKLYSLSEKGNNGFFCIEFSNFCRMFPGVQFSEPPPDSHSTTGEPLSRLVVIRWDYCAENQRLFEKSFDNELLKMYSKDRSVLQNLDLVKTEILRQNNSCAVAQLLDALEKKKVLLRFYKKKQNYIRRFLNLGENYTSENVYRIKSQAMRKIPSHVFGVDEKMNLNNSISEEEIICFNALRDFCLSTSKINLASLLRFYRLHSSAGDSKGKEQVKEEIKKTLRTWRKSQGPKVVEMMEKAKDLFHWGVDVSDIPCGKDKAYLIIQCLKEIRQNR